LPVSRCGVEGGKKSPACRGCFIERPFFCESKTSRAVKEGVNELESSRFIPLLAEEGWLRHQIRVAKPPKSASNGMVSSAKSSGLNSFAELLLRLRPIGLALRATPAAPFRNGSIFIYGASTPPLRGGEYSTFNISSANQRNTGNTRFAANVYFTEPAS